MIKGYLLNGSDIGKRITVSTVDYIVGGELQYVTHMASPFDKTVSTHIKIDIPGAAGGTRLMLEKDQDVELG